MASSWLHCFGLEGRQDISTAGGTIEEAAHGQKVCMCVCVCVCVCVCACVWKRERETERQREKEERDLNKINPYIPVPTDQLPLWPIQPYVSQWATPSMISQPPYDITISLKCHPVSTRALKCEPVGVFCIRTITKEHFLAHFIRYFLHS